MADEQPTEHNVYINPNVNVGTANDQSKVSGANVTVQSAGTVNVNSDTTVPPSFGGAVVTGMLGLLSAILTGIIPNVLPESWKPYLGVALPLALLVTGASIWVAYRQSRSGRSNVVLGGNLEQRNRRAMLTKVKHIWIDGLLEQSLAKELRIALDLTEHSDLVELPLNALVQELRHPPHELPAGTPIINVFDQMDGALLILGAPGAGKTTLLLELARDLIARAEQDDSQAIPVVFNLSSWATKRQPLKNWLIEELNTKYDVPRKVAQSWMDVDAILPLLDGLDEVAMEYQSDCVESINTYRQEYGLVPLTVCSRVADYEVLITKLRLQGAVVVQPLTRQKVDDYLERTDEKLSDLREALRHDTETRGMLDTPLMLSVVMLVYADKPVVEFRGGGTSDDVRRRLFDAYVTTMFGRRSKESRYSQEYMKHCLAWLAHKMIQQSLSIFLIEQLQPEWLLSRIVSFQYNILDRLLAGLVSGVAAGVVTGLASGRSNGLLVALSFGLIASLYGGQCDLDELQRRSINMLVSDILQGVLIAGVIYALGFGVFSGPGDVVRGLQFGVLAGGLFGLMTGYSGIGPKKAIIFERLNWSIRRAALSAISLLVIFLACPLIFLVISLVIDLSGSLFFAMINVLLAMLKIVLPLGLGFGLIGGLRGTSLLSTIRPNQGIKRSAFTALVVGPIVGFLVWLTSLVQLINLLGSEITSVPGIVSISTLVTGVASSVLFYGLIGCLCFGGYACLSHFSLRLVLWLNRSIPLRLVPFLDYCAERIFLRKVGGGYIFVHRLLMEYFASLYTEQPVALPNDRSPEW